jgi:hypothetical protein
MTACAAPNNAAGGHSRAPGPYSGFAQTAPQRRPTLTDITITQNAPVLVAIDISKARHEVLIAIPDKKRRRRLTVLNQLDDFNRLITLLASYGRPVRVAFEARGNYHRALAYLVLPRFSSGLFRAMFAMKEIKNGKKIHRRVSA